MHIPTLNPSHWRPVKSYTRRLTSLSGLANYMGSSIYRNLYGVFSHHFLSQSPGIAWWKIVMARSTNYHLIYSGTSCFRTTGRGKSSLEWCADPTRCLGVPEGLCSQGIWVRLIFSWVCPDFSLRLGHVIRAPRLSSPPMASPDPPSLLLLTHQCIYKYLKWVSYR